MVRTIVGRAPELLGDRLDLSRGDPPALTSQMAPPPKLSPNAGSVQTKSYTNKTRIEFGNSPGLRFITGRNEVDNDSNGVGK
jgi:hypothetical protein